jgi:hypothetical protein
MRRKRNELFEVLRQKGVDPADCKLIWAHDDSVTIQHPKTPVTQERTGSLNTSIFAVKEEPTRYLYQWLVADGPNSGASNACQNWEDVLEQLGYWAEEIRYVSDTPDLWAELQHLPEVMATAQDTGASNALFTSSERAEIARSLDDIRQLVRERFELTSEQLAAIDERLNEAEKASNRLGSKDWVMAFYGGMMSTFMTDAVPPAVIQTVLTTLVHGVAHIFGVGGPPPIVTA